jgi:hypothetical protein
MKTHQLLLSLALTLAVLPSAGPTASAQDTPNDGISTHMVVTVEARHGSSVPVVNREDVLVYQGHDRDKVTEWIPAQSDHAGLELFILIDDGSSPNLGVQLDDIRKFINSQPSSTKIGIAYMQDGTAKIVQDLTSDHVAAAKALRLPVGMGGVNASPYFSLQDLIKRWPLTYSRREVFMATDGIDRYYGSADLQDPYVAQAIDMAQQEGVIVYAIYTPGEGHFSHSYWQTYWGQLYLAQVADQTGGESYYIGMNGMPVAFAPFLEDAVNRWNHQYLLTFLAKPPKKSGMQQVKLRTEVPNAELVAADKVYLTAPPR